MKNTITEMKDTIEGINKINEAEEWVIELEKRRGKSLPWNRIKKKEWKEMKAVWETSGTPVNASTFAT